MRGLHLTADLSDCPVTRDVMVDPDALRQVCLAAVCEVGLRTVGEIFHRFEAVPGAAAEGPGGVTGVVLLAESHITIHTWPERGFAAIDLFLCGDTRPARALARIERTLAPTRVVTFRRDRGDDADTDR